jgi:hypothetical protein
MSLASEYFMAESACPARSSFLPGAAGLDAGHRGASERRQRETPPPHSLATATLSASELLSESPPRSSCPAHSSVSPHAHPSGPPPATTPSLLCGGTVTVLGAPTHCVVGMGRPNNLAARPDQCGHAVGREQAQHCAAVLYFFIFF